MRTPDCVNRLTALGIEYDDALSLRRISMTLRAWGEAECGNSNDFHSWSIERDEVTGVPYHVTHCHHGNYGWSVWCYADTVPDGGPGDMVRATRKTFATAEAATEYKHTIALGRCPEIRQVLSRRYKIADREGGALKRLGKIMAKYPALTAYHQTDPRGAALYVIPRADIPEGADIGSCYNRGVAVYK